MVSERAYLKGARSGAGLLALTNEVSRLLTLFTDIGAEVVDPAALLPADTLIDLYGEDLRGRAYTTLDPVEGERMLRPDFTVPVVQMHLSNGTKSGKYAYAGSVWRKQQVGSQRPTEYTQVGIEAFGGTNASKAEAEVFALISGALSDLPVSPVTGDTSLIFAAIEALDTSERRKAALRRHVWRPARFLRLLKRYSEPEIQSVERKGLMALLKNGDVRKVLESQGKTIGLRSINDIIGRMDILADEATAPRISAEDVEIITDILGLKCTMVDAAGALEKVAPKLTEAVQRIEERADELSKAGIDLQSLRFDAAYGCSSFEYYDGFVFGFDAPAEFNLPQIAQGGRYDALTGALGQKVPAVGGIIRPEALLALKAGVA